MSADLAHRIEEIERRLWVVESNCAGCPGSVDPQAFELDHFPPESCPQRRRTDQPQGVPDAT